MSLFKEMLAEKKNLEIKKTELERKIATLPQGELSLNRNGTRFKWFVNKEAKRIYLPKQEEKYARQLAEKNYLKQELRKH